jgi:hypothetical protein
MNRWWVVALALFLGYVGLLFGKVLVGREALFWHDVTIDYLPLQVSTADALRAGHLPLWEPRIGNGFPALAEGEVGVFYPPHLLILCGLPQYQVNALLVAAHLALGAFLMALLGRAWGLRTMPSLVAGATYGLSGFFVSHLIHVSMVEAAAWLPGVLWCAERWLGRPADWRWLGLGALFMGLQLLAAMPQIFFYSALTLVLYMLAAGLARGQGALPCRWIAAATAVVLVGAVLLGAVQMLPTAGLISQSARSAVTAANLREMSLAPRNLLYLLHPYLLGSYAEGNYFGRDHYYEVCGFAGTAALLFGLVGAFFGRGRGRIFGLVLVPAALFMALAEHNPLYALFPHLPGFSWFRAPGRYVLLMTLGLAALAGWGVHALGESRRAVKLTALLGGLGTVLCLALAPALGAARPLLLPKLAHAVGGQSEAVEKLDGLVARLSTGDPQMLMVTLSLALPALACGAQLLTGFAASWIGEAVLAVTLVQLFVFAWGSYPTMPPDYYARPPEVLRELDRGAGEALYMDDQEALHQATPGSPGWADGDLSYYWAERGPVRPNRQVLYNARSASVFYALVPDRYRKLSKLLQASLKGQKDEATGLRVADPAAVISALGARVVCTANRQALRPWPVALDRGWWLARRNPDPAPRVYFAQGALERDSAQSALEQLCRAGFSWRFPVVEGAGVGGVNCAGAQVLGVTDTCGRLDIQCRARARALLVVRDTWDRNVRCLVDGRPAPVLRANYLFRAVALTPGAHRVQFIYDARELRLGAVVTGLGVILLAALLGAGASRVMVAERGLA